MANIKGDSDEISWVDLGKIYQHLNKEGQLKSSRCYSWFENVAESNVIILKSVS